MKRLAKNSKGFTLIELMIVVAIIGILAAIAIPNFLRYQLKSKTAEARTNIGAIKTSQEAFRAEFDGYITAAAHPAAAPSDVKTPWVGNLGFNAIGYAPAGNVYYQYEVVAAGGTNVPNIAGTGQQGQSGAFAVSALGNLDRKGGNGMYIFASDTGVVKATDTVTTVATKNNEVQDVNPGEF